MSGHPPSLASPQNQHSSAATITQAFRQKPLRSAIVVFLIDFVFVLLVIWVARVVLPEQNIGLIAIAANTVLAAGFITFLGWWKKIGFNEPAHWRNLGLLILPALIIMVPPILGGFKAETSMPILTLIVGYTLTGITEEAIYRGVLLRILRPRGPVAAVVISSILFALAHLVNLFIRTGSPVIIFAQAVGAFCDGVGFAALRQRTHTLWFLVLLHMIHDLLLQLTNLPLIPLDVAQVTLLMIYGFYILYRRPKAEAVQETQADFTGMIRK